MLAIAAKELGVPVVAISRSYCLWEHIMCNQESLVVSESGRSWFPEEDEFTFRVIIGKRFDYVPPQLVTTLVGESRGWENKSIV
jgi:translation initiation factor 2B subunit (eIF-2B alpha/beta/delta family)